MSDNTVARNRTRRWVRANTRWLRAAAARKVVRRNWSEGT